MAETSSETKKYKKTKMFFQSEIEKRLNKGTNQFSGMATQDQEESIKKSWIIDSGATSHMSYEKNLFKDIKYNDETKCVNTAGANKMQIKGIGTVYLNVKQPSGNVRIIKLSQVLYIPSIVKNIISVNKILESGGSIRFSTTGCNITGKQGQPLAAMRINNQYVFEIEEETRPKAEKGNNCDEKTEEKGMICSLQEPNDWLEVQSLPNEEKKIWIESMKEELNNLKDQNVWTEQEVPSHIKTIATRWTYKIKTDEHGEFACARARLVAKGCFQKYGESYEETFAPVVKHTTIRILLNIITQEKLDTKHCDISCAFLYGNLEEEIYLKNVPGPWDNPKQGTALKLNKAIYGLKQAARQWNERIDKSLIAYGLQRGIADPCLYYMGNQKKEKLYLIIHVDDILMASNSNQLMKDLVDHLGKEYKVKDLGEVKCYLGVYIKINRELENMEIHQNPMIKKLISQLKPEQQIKSNIPMCPEYPKWKKDQTDTLPNNILYQSWIGSLLYIGLITRPDILLATNLLGRSVSKPTKDDWNQLKKIMQYLNSTKDFVMKITKTKETNLECYTDADWGGEITDRKSTSGYCIYLSQNLIHWGTKKQNSVALSTTEAEYTAMALGVQELQWIIIILEDFHIKLFNTPVIHCDNNSAISVAQSEKMNQRTKHVAIKFQFIRDLFNKKLFTINHCGTQYMIADILTKPLAKQGYQNLRKYLGITNSEET